MKLCCTFWRQRTCRQDDYKRKKPDNECFQDPQSCAGLGVTWNQFRPQDPSQIQWHQNRIRRHTMKSSFVFGQHQSCSDVEKNIRRCRWRRCCCSTVLTRFGFLIPKRATMDVALELHVVGSAQRRRERRLRVWWREQFTIFMRGGLRLVYSSRHSHMRVTSESTQIEDEVLVAFYAATLLRFSWLNTWFQHF